MAKKKKKNDEEMLAELVDKFSELFERYELTSLQALSFLISGFVTVAKQTNCPAEVWEHSLEMARLTLSGEGETEH